MKTLMLLLTALTLAACAPTPTAELPNWEAAERGKAEVADPIKLPQLCQVPWPSDSVECWSRLDKYDIVADGNTEIAQGNADALRKTEAAYDHLLNAGKMQQELAEIRQDLLEDERRQREWDKWYYRAIILGGLVAVGVSQ